MSDEEYRAAAKKALDEHVAEAELEPEADRELPEAPPLRLGRRAVGLPAGTSSPTLLEEGKDRIRAFYLAVAPELFGADLARKIGKHGLVTPKTRVVIEKPIGHDLAVGARASTTRSARSSTSGRSTASTTISARRRCRT